MHPDHLLDQAQKLIAPLSDGAPRQVDLRRAISAAYYGVFHAVLGAAADEFVGKTKQSTIQYTLVYRSVAHGALRSICENATKPKMPVKYARYAPSGGFGNNIQRFAAAVLELQERRHAADYDPSIRFKMSDASVAINTARSAVDNF
jgi:uncharacterized protein (UPF0332 family)